MLNLELQNELLITCGQTEFQRESSGPLDKYSGQKLRIKIKKASLNQFIFDIFRPTVTACYKVQSYFK